MLAGIPAAIHGGGECYSPLQNTAARLDTQRAGANKSPKYNR